VAGHESRATNAMHFAVRFTRSGAAVIGAFGVALTIGPSRAEAADPRCPQDNASISTDRPSTTNSSTVVPLGSLQSENGIELTGRNGSTVLDGTESRLRLGIAPCLEVFVDVPTYFIPLRGQASWGWSNVSPALSWQLGPADGFDLALIAGVGLPTGAQATTGPGAQPFLDLTWSHGLDDGWGVEGMLSSQFTPANSISTFAQQVTFDVGKSVSSQAGVFVEYVGTYPVSGGSSQLVDGGATYDLTPKQQLDVHIAAGLNRNAPNWVFGVGYSFRLDQLFGKAGH
jgi:hypothetical protein